MEFEKEMPENREIFRIEPSGEIYINSNLVGNDTDIVKALRQVLEPEINKNKIYDEMLEMLQESASTIKWYMDNCVCDNHESFFNIGMVQRTEIEYLIKRATT